MGVEKLTDSEIDLFFREPQLLAERIDGSWQKNMFAEVLIREAMKCISVDDGRLIIEAPVRHGKSTAISILLPVWLQCFAPDLRMWSVSHTAGLNTLFGRKVRNLCKDALPLVGRTLSYDSDSVTRFHVDGFPNGGYAGFPSGAIPAGDGYDILIVDDPIKESKDVDTLKKRDALWEWFTSTLVPRGNPCSSIIFVMARWHKDDIIGRLQALQPGVWSTVTMRAIKEEGDIDYLGPREIGEALRPNHLSTETLLKYRSTMSAKTWAANYQQKPITDESRFFDTTKIRIDNGCQGREIRAWDLAASEGKGDWTVGVKMRTDGRTWHIADVIREQYNPSSVDRLITATAMADGKKCQIVLPQDPGQAGKSQAQRHTAMLAGFNVKTEPQTGSKQTRAQGLATQIEIGNITVQDAYWTPMFIEEFKSFPFGAHDDIVDATASAFNATIQPVKRTRTRLV